MDSLIPLETIKICRSCMSDGSDKNLNQIFQLYSIYDHVESYQSQNIKICELLNIAVPKLPTIDIMDSLPKQICTDCFEKLNACYAFQNSCLNADHQLRNSLQTNVVIAVENIKQETPDTLQGGYIADGTIKQEHEGFDEFINIIGAENESIEIYEVKQFEEAPEFTPTFDASTMDGNVDGGVKVGDKTDIESIKGLTDQEKPTIKRYTCEFCDSTYTENRNLQRHIRSKHTSPMQTDKEISMKDKLIEAVQMFPCLFDRNDSQYRNKYAMDKAWNTVSIATGETITDCQIRWRSLRDTYVKQLEISKGKSGNSEERKRKWRYIDAMSFLQEHIEPRHLNIVDDHLARKQNKNDDGQTNALIKLENDDDEFSTETFDSTASNSKQESQTSSNEIVIGDVAAQDSANVKQNIPEGVQSFHMWECKTCLQLFYHKKNLIRHMKNQHGEEISKDAQVISEFTDINKLSTLIKCDECDRLFHKQSAYNLHKYYHRNPGASKTCKFCNRTFKKIEKLRDHERTHSNEKAHLCPDCGKTFGSSDSLTQHRLRHTGEKRYECAHCPKKFFANSDLRGHIRQVHNTKRPFVCEVCGAAFKRPNCLKNHTLVHTGEKRYKCEYCDKGFTSGDNLRRHVRSHTGEKPCKCEYCPSSFKSTSDLKKHLAKHIGVNIYRCELCPSAFPLARDLRTHFATHKNDDEETKARNKQALLEAEEQLKIKIKENAVDIAADDTTMEENISSAVKTASIEENTSFVLKSENENAPNVLKDVPMEESTSFVVKSDITKEESVVKDVPVEESISSFVKDAPMEEAVINFMENIADENT